MQNQQACIKFKYKIICVYVWANIGYAVAPVSMLEEEKERVRVQCILKYHVRKK